MVRPLLAAILLLTAPLGASAAAEPPGGERDPQAMAREGLELLLRALEDLVESIPQYELPEVTEEGDIIIRRKPPPQEREREPGEPETERI